MMPGRRIAPRRIRKAACIEIGIARARALPMSSEIDRHLDIDHRISDRADIARLRTSHPVHAGVGKGSGITVEVVDEKNKDFRSWRDFGSLL